MNPLPIAASTLTNACGIGMATIRDALRSGTSGLRPNDFEPAATLATWIGRVDELERVQLAPALADYDCRNNRLAWLALQQDDFMSAVSAAARRHGRNRVGIFLGTTTSGILSTELAYRARAEPGAADALSPELYRHKHALFATTEFVRASLGLAGPALTVSTACSSSAKVFAAAARSIAAGDCAAAVVGGVDSLALSTLYGFHSLELLSRQPCRPCAHDRDGISIGEGAGFALLDPGVESAVQMVGTGESSDAYHMSSPHPEGLGAARAMQGALASAALSADAIDYVALHGTASRPNDAAEDRAVFGVFGGSTSVSSTKGWTGHTLGAAGITGLLLAELALRDQWIPRTLHCDVVDPLLRCAVATASRAQPLRRALCNAFGFGGTNCSVVLARTP